MPKLTDDELGELLRETFAGKESLADRLPEAPKRRRPTPALLAAAAVVAVLAGVLYGVGRLGPADPVSPADSVSPAATAAVTRSPARPYTVSTVPLPPFTNGGEIWGAVTVDLLRRFKPDGGGDWEAVQVNGGHPPGVKPAITFSPGVKAQIADAVRPVAPVRWGGPESPVSCTPGRIPIVFLDPIVYRGDQAEVHTFMTWGCGAKYQQSVTYRVEKVGGSWKVTAR
ncbi:hypothetical protein [Kribbella sp. HUAS MG21]|uniref:Uncharacterized protein n=1 Tax=Kribbella sp. HUAS MG21 TaxID=3160966 RepID=A0AAU7TIX1_9ACTN